MLPYELFGNCIRGLTQRFADLHGTEIKIFNYAYNVKGSHAVNNI